MRAILLHRGLAGLLFPSGFRKRAHGLAVYCCEQSSATRYLGFARWQGRDGQPGARPRRGCRPLFYRKTSAYSFPLDLPAAQALVPALGRDGTDTLAALAGPRHRLRPQHGDAGLGNPAGARRTMSLTRRLGLRPLRVPAPHIPTFHPNRWPEIPRPLVRSSTARSVSYSYSAGRRPCFSPSESSTTSAGTAARR